MCTAPCTGDACVALVRAARRPGRRMRRPHTVDRGTRMLKKIHHVAVVVRDADQALGFYRDALGLHVTADQVIEDQGVRGVLLEAGEGEMELIQPVREGTGVARFLETKGEGLAGMICFLHPAASTGVLVEYAQP